MEKIRLLTDEELDEAADLASNSLSSDTDAEGKRIYPWSAGESKPYYEKIFHGIHGNPNTHFVGLFVDGKMAGVIYSTSVRCWLKAMKSRNMPARIRKALKPTGVAENKAGYIGGLAVAGEFKGKGYGTLLLESEVAHAGKRFKALVCYLVKGSKSESMVVKAGFKKIFSTNEKTTRHWFAKW